MSTIVTIAGSPSAESRSSILLNYLGKQLEEKGHTVKRISVLDAEPRVLIEGDYKAPIISEIAEAIETAGGIIIASPVYKAAYSGALKALLDLLPQDAFKGKPVLPIMTGGSHAHLLAIDYSLKPLLAALHAQTILKGIYYTDAQVDKSGAGQPILDEELLARTKEQLGQFAEIVAAI